METIDFARNFDNKLARPHFTTIRRHSSSRYVTGDIYLVTLKEQPLFTARIIEIRPVFVNRLSDYLSYMDMGYCAADGIAILKNMYRDKVKDFDREIFDFILLEKINDIKKCETTHRTCSEARLL